MFKRKPKHLHKWKVLSTEVTESQLELVTRALKESGRVLEGSRSHMYERKHIQILTCDECGELKRFVENI